jgi:hypothetical protein
MATTKQQFMDQWLLETDPERRETLLQEMMKNEMFPDERDYEDSYGLYPDLDDPNFIQKLFNKREFGENKSDSIQYQMKMNLNSCDTNVEFEVSPLQRFVKNFLSGKTPYNSALLYHGVGVGKTCSSIGIAEANLHFYPNKKVFIIAPPNIQPNFERTIFDIENVLIPKESDVPNTHSGCTGNLYLELTGTEYEKDRKVIEKKVKKLIRSRYEVMGYFQLYSYVQRIINSVPQTKELSDRDERIRMKLQREFSNHCMIIDEAHNLRDIPTSEEEDTIDLAGGEVELSDSQQGKKLTPVLKKILQDSDSMKLVLLTATPMYNSYLEILFLLNLLLINDKRPIIRDKDIFKENRFTESGKKLFGSIVRNYVSFMRGETPMTFPTRLKPFNTNRIEKWFSVAPNQEVVKLTDNQYKGLLELPLVPVSFPESTYNDYITIFESSIETQKMSLASVDTMIQSGNWLFPSLYDSDLEDRIRDTGFDNCFKTGSEYSTKSAIRYKSTIEPPSWLIADSEDGLVQYSPKAAFIIKNIRKAEGVVFIYSRFIKSGALPLALALEANGYTPYGRDKPMLVDGNQIPQGRQCAKCSNREKEHSSVDHKFVPAKYVLLTGRKDLSPNNTASVLAERGKTNFDASDVKVVIGSEVASEGIDLRFVREIYVFDSWYHLNRMEQVLGRGIRTCSHALLPEEKRNCTIYLLVNVLKDQRESADLYMYRRAMIKSQEIGNVTRFIKQHALDCNLNIDVNIIKGLDDRIQIDSQQNKRTVVINDEAYTNMCDWMECEYTCAEPIDIDPNNLDNLTYDDYTAEWRENQIKSKIRALFQSSSDSKGLMMIPDEKMTDIFSGIPAEALFSILHDIVNNKSFRIKVNEKEGYITYKNGYYLFQPIKLQDLEIPLALRSADYPIKQDVFRPLVEQKNITKETVLKVGTSEEEEKKEETKLYKQFWNETTQWCSKIQEGTAELKIPNNVKTLIQQKFSTNENILSEILQKLEMIIWLYRSRSLRDNQEYRSILSYVTLEFVWDYCLMYNEQIELSKEKDNEVIQKVAAEHLLKNNVFRYISPNPPFNIMYWCDTKPCDQIIIDMMEKDTTEKYSIIKANVETTSNYYGFLVPKSGSIVTLKLVGINSRVAEVDNVPPSGAECKGIQTKAPKLDLLYKLAEYLKNAGLPDFDLNKLILESTADRIPKNTNAYCALIEFVLRWMDIKQVKNRRWFYRPISAYKTKHYARGAKVKK